METNEFISVGYAESVANHLLVKIKDDSALTLIEQSDSNLNIRHLSKDKYIVEYDDFGLYTVPDAIEAYSTISTLRYAEPDYIIHSSLSPNDTSYNSLWGLHNTGQTGGTTDADIDAPEAWAITTGSSSVVVAVIDTGVDYTHNDLAANMWINTGETAGNGLDDDGNGYIDDIYGYDFHNNDANPMDDQYHGTHVAGTIGGVGDNSNGVTGVAWQTKLMALKFLNSSGSGYTSDAIQCVEYATDNGAHVTSNSWGGGGYSQSLKDAIDDAASNEILFIAAAGNSGTNNDSSPHYPSSYSSSNIIAVASTDSNDNRSSFSCYGATSVDIGAPGSSIYSTMPGDSYGTLSGTSMATPHVSGVVALLLAEYPSESMGTIQNRILYSGDSVSSMSGITTTGRRLNAYNALTVDVSISEITSPSENSTLNSGTVTFSYSSGSAVSSNVYWVGSSQGVYDLDNGYTSGGSLTVNVPTDGSTVWIRLWSEMGGNWFYNEYSYTCATIAPAISEITSPSENSTLNSGTVTFAYS
ncbi:MAG: S8 family serine peptidase, partial [Lentisphaeraceae bacterium]|nr:S8 family serine peptidase [Lentisphaeraceae bacterium]